MKEYCFKLRFAEGDNPAGFVISPSGRKLAIADQSFKAVLDFIEEINSQTARHRKAWAKLMGHIGKTLGADSG